MRQITQLMGYLKSSFVLLFAAILIGMFLPWVLGLKGFAAFAYYFLISIILTALTIFIFELKVKKSKLILEEAAAVKGEKAIAVNFEDFCQVSAKVISELRSRVGKSETKLKKLNIISMQLLDTSENVAYKSGASKESLQYLSSAINEISVGTISLAQEIENCAEMMDKLSEYIHTVNNRFNETNSKINHIKSTNLQGAESIKALENEYQSNKVELNEVIRIINTFGAEWKNIWQFTKIINSISEQTKLLSLNASIEAARAGEAGKGFSVVADEIGKLANSSRIASEDISKVMQGIQDKYTRAIETMETIKKVINEQDVIIDNVKSTFSSFTDCVEDILNDIHLMEEEVQRVEENKEKTMEAIHLMSAASEEIAASTEEINATIAEQNQIMNDMDNTAKEMSEMAVGLSQSLAG